MGQKVIITVGFGRNLHYLMCP